MSVTAVTAQQPMWIWPEGSNAAVPEVCDNHVADQVGIGLLARDAEGARLKDLVQALLAHGRAIQL